MTGKPKTCLLGLVMFKCVSVTFSILKMIEHETVKHCLIFVSITYNETLRKGKDEINLILY